MTDGAYQQETQTLKDTMLLSICFLLLRPNQSKKINEYPDFEFRKSLRTFPLLIDFLVYPIF